MKKAVSGRALRRTGIGIALFLGLMLFLVPITLRNQGFVRLRELEAEMARRGDWHSAEQFVAGVKVDESLQEEFWAWQERFVASDSIDLELDFSPDHENELLRWMASPPGTPLSCETARRLDGFLGVEIVEEGRRLLRRDGLVQSTHGWAAIDLRSGRTVDDLYWSPRGQSLLARKGFARHLKISAFLAGDADPWLRDLDTIVAAGDPPGDWIDGMILFTLGNLRDEAYMGCAIRGNVSAAQLESWMEQKSNGFLWAAKILRGERLLRIRPMSEYSISDIYRLSSLDETRGLWGRARDILKIPWLWASMPHDAALRVECLYRLERRLRGDRSIDLDNIEDAWLERWTEAVNTVASSLYWTVALADDSDAMHRIFRLAARVVVDARQGRAIPVRDEEFRERYPGKLDGREDRFPLQYHRWGEGRFRISIKPRPQTGSLLHRRWAAGVPIRDYRDDEIEAVYRTWSGIQIDVLLPRWLRERSDTTK